VRLRSRTLLEDRNQSIECCRDIGIELVWALTVHSLRGRRDAEASSGTPFDCCAKIPQREVEPAARTGSYGKVQPCLDAREFLADARLKLLEEIHSSTP
jgi:hypothetical protein